MFSTDADSSLNPPSGARPGPSSTALLALDNLMRRELRVGDPRDPTQVAKALVERYQSDPRARAIQGEAEGIPFQLAPRRIAPAAAADTATSIDLRQAMRDVQRDLDELTRNNLLKGIEAELDGWADGIRSAMAQGVDAARFGLDPRNRDRAFGIRRTLGDYARMARLVGALTPSAIHQFRSLARSIDEVAAVILVMLGESLANNGFAGGRFLLQAPFTDLQARRDACMQGLRNLLASLAHQPGPNEWPRGIDAYRRLFDALEAQGQGDLRALMTEPELSRVLDDLVRRAAHGSAEGLRALGSTAQIELNRVYRLINFGYRLVDPESPPLTSFLEALRLFADGFNPAGGSRLLRIARPPIVFYGLYGGDEDRHSDRRLVDLTMLRGRLAGQIDCFARCDCEDDAIPCLILLDKLLYDVDRAIDLYAVGNEDLGLPELRAAAYGYVIDEFVKPGVPPGKDPRGKYLKCDVDKWREWALISTGDESIKMTLGEISKALKPSGPTDDNWGDVRTSFDERRMANGKLKGSSLRFTEVMYQELCLQKKSEQRWEAMVAQMSRDCGYGAKVLGNDGYLSIMLGNAMTKIVNGTTCVTSDAKYVRRACGLDGPSIPADIATSLDTWVQNRAREGGELVETVDDDVDEQ